MKLHVCLSNAKGRSEYEWKSPSVMMLDQELSKLQNKLQKDRKRCKVTKLDLLSHLQFRDKKKIHLHLFIYMLFEGKMCH